MSSSSRRQNDVHTAIPDEYDSTDRTAAFYLYTRPLDDAILGESDSILLHHWALVAVFVDESIRTMEAYDSNGRLMPVFLKEGPRESQEARQGKFWELIPVITSPNKLREVTENNSLNGTRYKANGNNCQSWVKQCASNISYKLARALDNYKSNGEVSIIKTASKCSWASSKSSSQSVRRALVSSSKSMCSKFSNIDHHHIN